jgi:hypothetical protein
MVSGTSHSTSCNCNTTYTGTSSGASGDYYGTAATNYTCGCCQGYGVITFTTSNTVDMPEEAIEQNIVIFFMSDIIRTIFYKILIFTHYVECRARAPPLRIRCFDINRGLEPYLDLWCFQEPLLPTLAGDKSSPFLMSKEE